MGMEVNLHLSGEQKVDVRTSIYDNTDPEAGTRNEFAVVSLDHGDNMVKIYTRKLSDLETMSFHLSALIQELRDEYEWE